MRRRYTAQIMRVIDGNIILNVDLGFHQWTLVTAKYLNQQFKRPVEFKLRDWVVVSIYQRKYTDSSSLDGRRYEYDAVIVSEAKEPRAVFTR